MSIQKLTNHFGFIIDRSGSMGGKEDTVVKVFDAQIANLRRRSVDLNQETRVSVYLFNVRLECLVFDMDVMRMPTLAGLYRPGGGTALRDSVALSLDEMAKICQLRSDHAFLVYTITDGQEVDSYLVSPEDLKNKLNGLPENWTVACLVPDARGQYDSQRCGFAKGNIEIWNTSSSEGLEVASASMANASERFMQARATGVRSTKSLFQVDIADVKVKDIKAAAGKEVKGPFTIFQVGRVKDSKIRIDDFVRGKVGAYTKGHSHYRLDKSELVQDHKVILLRHTVSGKVFDNGRATLGLPDAGTVRVKPGDAGVWQIFIQSKSDNRNLFPGSEVLVLS